jgi:SH3-like domain-containing protein
MKLSLGVLFLLTLIFTNHFARAACSKGEVVLHVEPNKNSQESWKVNANMPFTVTASKTEWLQVKDFQGQSHWGMKKDFDLKGKCAVIKSESADAYLDLPTKSKSTPYAKLERFAPFKILKSNKDWLLLEDSLSAKLWVDAKDVWTPKSR